jgi:GNAT superfamily N-acetyltransferase
MIATVASKIQLETSPSPSSYFRQTAIMQCLAFSHSSLSQWWSISEKDMTMKTVEDIPPLRIYLTERDHRHRELNPTSIVVTALIDGVVVGSAYWQTPKSLWQSETLMELLYRKTIQTKDKLEDWLYPQVWYRQCKRDEFYHAQEAKMIEYVGENGIEDMWYLKLLCTSPDYQRKGIGAALLDWGLNRARVRGEKVYLEASEFGKGLYLKKGFKEIGTVVVGNGAIVLPCMLWDPETEKQVIAEQNNTTVSNLRVQELAVNAEVN